MTDSLFATSYILMWALVVFQVFLVIALLKQTAELRQRAEMGVTSVDNRLPTGTRAPQFSAVDLISGTVVNNVTGTGKRRLLLFLAADCTLCRRVARELRYASDAVKASVVPLCYGRERPCANILVQLKDSGLMLLANQKDDIPYRYRVSGFPTIVIVDEQGRIGGYRFPQSTDDVAKAIAIDRDDDVNTHTTARVEEVLQ